MGAFLRLHAAKATAIPAGRRCVALAAVVLLDSPAKRACGPQGPKDMEQDRFDWDQHFLPVRVVELSSPLPDSQNLTVISRICPASSIHFFRRPAAATGTCAVRNAAEAKSAAASDKF